MDTTDPTATAPHVRGGVVLAFAEAFCQLHLLAADDVATLLHAVHVQGWYPLATVQQLFTMVQEQYVLSPPILERVGMEFITSLARFSEWRSLFKTGLTFLQAHTEAKFYANLVQGNPRDIGALTLVQVNEAAGTAVMRSTTPFSKNLERGVLLRGLQLTHSFDHVQVENSVDEQVYHIAFYNAARHTPVPLSAIAAQDFLGATRLTANRLLAGAELQHVFWRYKELERALAHQQAFWDATHRSLANAFAQLRTQDRALHEQHRQLTEAHATSEMLKAGIVDAVPDAIITTNEASEIVEFNAGAERVFGYQRADVLGRLVAEVVIPAPLRQRHTHGLQRYLATGAARILGQHLELEALHADGHVFPVELSITEVRLATRRVFTAYVRDLTERARMERALRESEQRFRSLAEVHPVPVGIVSVEAKRFLYVSPGLASLLGCSVADLLAREPAAIFADAAEFDILREKMRTQGAVDVHECTLRKADGTYLPASVTAKRIVYEGVHATVAAVMDLTERRHAEAELARQREALYQNEKLSALGSLLAGVAHELNNPLSVVVGRAIMLEEEAGDPETAAAVSKIRQAAERCARIVKTFLAMARQQQPERTPVHLNALVTPALDLVGYGLRTAGVEVRLDLAPDLPPLWADAAQMHQVLSNLLVNAQQALLPMPEPRWLQVATGWDAAANVLHLTVTDNGPGVPAPIRSRIFDPFFTTKPKGVGTGVGLSLSHGIIAAHGGTLTLESPPEGGARFVITLPLLAAVPPGEAAVSPAQHSIAPRTMLIVDDEPEVAAMLSDILTRTGHQTTVAHSGNAALACLARRNYDLILSDLHMPDLNGLDLYRHIQTSYPYLGERIVFITGDTLGATTRHFLTETGAPYLEKPIIPRDVVSLVQRLLA